MHRGVFVELGQRLRRAREERGLSQAELEAQLGIGPGWVNCFEMSDPIPDTPTLLALAHALGTSAAVLLKGINPDEKALQTFRQFEGVGDGPDLLITFPYGRHDAVYRLPGATVAELDLVLGTLRSGLGGPSASIQDDPDGAENLVVAQSDAVANSFLAAVRLWPHANPSDLWYFVVYRAYLDPFNHPAANARLDLAQSWKRTGGWALERIAVRHYAEFLKAHDVTIVILDKPDKEPLLKELNVEERLEADKLDVALLGGPKKALFGVVHVKASFAERRTDDVPMSQALVRAGYFSPLWTMDCKATPGSQPINRGELGKPGERKSAKRKDIEDDGYFSGCFSYNRNTVPTPPDHMGPSFVAVCDFSDPDDSFSRAVINAWSSRSKANGALGG
jgi:transcriptional regulator with XRE-family HTH domain